MSNITFKVAPKGEGKTKWLLSIAYKYSRHHKIYLMTENGQEFSKFCDKYFATYHEVCPVNKYESSSITENAVILIDDLLNHCVSTTTLDFMRRNCFKLFITVDGVTEDSSSDDPYEFSDYEQLTLFDMLKEETYEG